MRGGGHGKRGGGGREELINAYGFDTKYAMHCSRLGFQGIELLETGQLNLPIEGEPADWLRAVRHGEVAFAEWWKRSLELDAALESMETDESLPPTADRARIDTWLARTHRSVWDRLESPG